MIMLAAATDAGVTNCVNVEITKLWIEFFTKVLSLGGMLLFGGFWFWLMFRG